MKTDLKMVHAAFELICDKADEKKIDFLCFRRLFLKTVPILFIYWINRMLLRKDIRKTIANSDYGIYNSRRAVTKIHERFTLQSENIEKAC